MAWPRPPHHDLCRTLGDDPGLRRVARLVAEPRLSVGRGRSVVTRAGPRLFQPGVPASSCRFLPLAHGAQRLRRTGQVPRPMAARRGIHPALSFPAPCLGRQQRSNIQPRTGHRPCRAERSRMGQCRRCRSVGLTRAVTTTVTTTTTANATRAQRADTVCPRSRSIGYAPPSATDQKGKNASGGGLGIGEGPIMMPKRPDRFGWRPPPSGFEP